MKLDPPDDGTARPRRLTEVEAQAIRSGSGYLRRTNPGSHAEHNAQLQPYLARGFGANRPGLYHQMARRSPKIAGNLRRRELAIAALDWRILNPPDPSARDRNRTELVRQMFCDIEGGLQRFIEQKFRGTETYGFALFEKVWEIEERTGYWRYAKLAHIEPWTVKTWVIDGNGYLVSVIFRFETFDDVNIVADKLIHFARRFNGRNYEGESALRPLYFYDEQKRRMAVGNAITFERAGEGVVVVIMAGDFPPGTQEYTDAVSFGQDWASGSQAFMIQPPSVEEVKFVHGGQNIPDFEGYYRYADHQVDHMTGGFLSELGHSKQGARALGSEMRGEEERAVEGLCNSFCRDVEQKAFRPLYERNGWRPDRMCRLTVSGFEDPGRLSLMMQAFQGGEGPVLEKTDEDEDKIRRALGFGPGSLGG